MSAAHRGAADQYPFSRTRSRSALLSQVIPCRIIRQEQGPMSDRVGVQRMRPWFRLAAAVGVVTLAMFTAGCNSGTAGPAIPTSGDREPTTAGTSTVGTTPSTAPKVTNPLNAAKFVNAPCTALTSSDLGFLGLGGARINDATRDSSCVWNVVATSTIDSVSWMTVQSTGLRSVYAAEGSIPGGFKYFEPTTVDGYPAVYESLVDDRQYGFCDISVGVNDSLYFSVQYHAATANRTPANATLSCSMAVHTASAVLRNLKANQGP